MNKPIDIDIGYECLHRLFPFHFVIDQQLEICKVGSSLNKVAECDLTRRSLSACFSPPQNNPELVTNFELLAAKQGVTLKLTSRFNKNLVLRGELQQAASGHLLFLGSPVIASGSKLFQLDLNYSDFAAHDLSIEYAFLLKAKQSVQKDMGELLLYLEQEKTQLETTLNSINDALLIVGIDGYIYHVSELAAQLFDHNTTQLLGHLIDPFFSFEGPQKNTPFTQLLTGEKYIELPKHCYLIQPNEKKLKVKGSLSRIKVQTQQGHEAHTYTRYVLKFIDFEGNVFDNRLRYLAEHDDVTGLKNRPYFLKKLREEIQLSLTQKRQFSILFIDCNKFKHVNDHYGHLVGDKLLRIIGERLTHHIKDHDIVCRYGGDEFLLLIKEPSTLAVNTIVKSIHAGFKRSCFIDQHELKIKLSIGISSFPQDGHDTASLINKADTQMYQNKVNRTTYYS